MLDNCFDNCSSTAVPDAILPPASMQSCVALTSDLPVGGLHCSRPLFLTRFYLLLPWSRTFLHLTAMDGGNAQACWEQA